MEDFFEMLLPFAWVLIPLTAIAAGGFKEWLKFKHKQAELGASAHELEKEVAELKRQLREKDGVMDKRMQNLETIVTSQVWDLIHEESGMAEDKLPSHMLDELRDPESREPTNSEKVDQIASRMKS